MIEEIRKRIKARMDNTDAAGDYDEYADGQGVGLAAALRIIDEVEKEHPIPSDVQEAAEKAALHYDMGTEGVAYQDGYKDGMLAERDRMMSGALCGNVDMCGVSAWVKLPSKVLSDYLRSNFKGGDEVRIIIIKKEK